REYAGMSDLTDLYREDWTVDDLHMDAAAWNPGLRRYIAELTRRAAGLPVLQFNRVDFRLPWLKAQFPRAKILHLYRNPRDQWCSTLKATDPFPPTGRLGDFKPSDGFYLLRWAEDLRRPFPVLRLPPDRHPYELFHLIWRLSHAYGTVYADWSIPYETLAADPPAALRPVVEALKIADPPVDEWRALSSPATVDRWKSYAPADWFEEREARTAAALAEFVAGAPAMEVLQAKKDDAVD
ncbi:MAG: hypothetical protein ACRC1K_07795, partial [Planctomycetia bacterium]